MGWHAILHGIFWIQGSNLCLLHLLHWQMGSFTTSTSWEAHPMNTLVKIKPMSRYRISSMEERRFKSATLFIFCRWFSLLLVSYYHSLLFIIVIEEILTDFHCHLDIYLKFWAVVSVIITFYRYTEKRHYHTWLRYRNQNLRTNHQEYLSWSLRKGWR